MSDIINKWDVLRNLSKDFVSNINLVHIFGSDGNQVIVIANDNNVYSFGDNDSYGCLGLGHTNPVKKPTKIEELRAKQVKQIEFGYAYRYVTALTRNGNLYSWGTNEFGELGIGNTTPQSKPSIINALNDKNVIDIKMDGYFHSMALTVCGDVYIWGDRVGNSPIKMTYESLNQKIIAISIGCSHALALTNTGNVLYWGNNEYGQCGNGSTNSNYAYDAKWCESLHTTDLNISKIVCARDHSIVLSAKGDVYCFGCNQFGQCGDGTNDNRNIPTKVKINEKFIDICATKHNHMSVGLTANACYIWGQIGYNSIYYPIEIPSIDMNQVLQRNSENITALMPLRFNEKHYKSSLIGRISEKFNKREFSDISFKVEDKHIYAQKAHVINVCKYFEAMFSDKKWLESKSSEIEIKDYSYTVYYAFIKYLYTDCVDIGSDEDVLELLDLANCYLDETLKQRCVTIISNSIKNENVFAFYYSAVKYNSSKLKAYCIEYIKNNIADETDIEAIMDNAVKFTEK